MYLVRSVREPVITVKPLEVKYKGKSIADVLDMTVDDAVEFFSAIPKIQS